MPSFLKRLQQSQRDRATNVFRAKDCVIHGAVVYEITYAPVYRYTGLYVSPGSIIPYSCNKTLINDLNKVILNIQDGELRIYVGKYSEMLGGICMFPCPFAKKKTFESVNAALSFVTKMYFKTN